MPYITLITAPSIDTSEVESLKKHWQEAERDPDYVIVLNYECRVDLVEVPDGSKVLVTAPNITTSELSSLRKQVEAALTATDPLERIVVCNYEVRIDVIEYEESN